MKTNVTKTNVTKTLFTRISLLHRKPELRVLSVIAVIGAGLVLTATMPGLTDEIIALSAVFR